MKTFTFYDWLHQSGGYLLNIFGNPQYHVILLGLIYTLALQTVILLYFLQLMKLSGGKIKAAIGTSGLRSRNRLSS